MFKIEKNIPLEKPEFKRSKYAFLKDMEIGDSFECGSCFVASIRNYAHAFNIKIVTRRNSHNSHRIWRVK